MPAARRSILQRSSTVSPPPKPDLGRRRVQLEAMLARLRRQADTIAHTGGDGGDLRLVRAAQVDAEIASVDAAIARIDAGTYGRCARCGDPIADLVLAASPVSTTCRRCA